MQPYQEASKEIRRQGELPLKALKTAGSIAATSYLGGGAINRVLPLLSKYIPEDLAIKGLSKIDPRFGKFISTALNNGKSFDEVRDFITGKAEEGEEQQAPEQRNIIAQYDDKLHSFIDNLIKQGRSALEAGALARTSGKFEKSISKMEKDHKANFSSIIESVYGMGQPQQAQKMQPEQQQMQQPQQTQGQGIDPQLMQLMQGIRSSIQNIRGR